MDLFCRICENVGRLIIYAFEKEIRMTEVVREWNVSSSEVNTDYFCVREIVKRFL